MEEETLPDYSQVVDSTHSRRFEAPVETGWGDVWAHGGEYVTAGASTSEARFKLKTPQAATTPSTPGGRSGRTAAVPRDSAWRLRQGHAVGRGEPGPRQGHVGKARHLRDEGRRPLRCAR